MTRRTSLLIGMVAAVAGGCGDPTAPFNPEVTNVADSFQFQVTLSKAVTRTVEYTWVNTGTTANVDQASSFSGGTGTLTIVDTDLHIVYDRDLVANGTFQTTAGTAGTWVIHVVLRDAKGAVNFRVQKP